LICRDHHGTKFNWDVFFLSGAVSDISPYIKHYEGLSYDREDLHRMHLRTRRAAQPQHYTLQLDFSAFHSICLKSINTCQPLVSDWFISSAGVERSTYLSQQHKALTTAVCVFVSSQNFPLAFETKCSSIFPKFHGGQ
uniref:Uncharacterized protein n=1 Tax=Scophthalmus maximus TaxID=52904 RepID=A0A8D3D7U7_SCOMX